MRPTRFLASALIAGVAALTMTAPVSSAPLMNGAALSQAVPNSIENVQHRHHHHHRRHFHGGHRHHYHGGGGGAGAVLGGLAAGAIIGGAIAAGQANAAQQNHSYCAQRFRSYDPRSGTYLGHDGYRHPCP